MIGRDCVIGRDVTITGSHLWGHVTIEDGVTIDRAILCDGVIVRKGAKIGMLCYACVLVMSCHVMSFISLCDHHVVTC